MHEDDSIQLKYEAKMNVLAQAIDKFLNGEAKGTSRKVAFVLLLAETGAEAGRVNYISNGNRADMRILLKEFLARLEGQPEMSGRA